MIERPFLDTNVLLYLLSAERAKADRTEALLSERAVISVQVLNEFSAVATRKFGLSWEEVGVALAAVRATCRVEPVTVDAHDLGRELAQRHRLAFYDGVIAASALLA